MDNTEQLYEEIKRKLFMNLTNRPISYGELIYTPRNIPIHQTNISKKAFTQYNIFK